MVTVGSPLTGAVFSTVTCGNGAGCTWANTALGGAGTNVTSPVSGVVVLYRIAGGYSGTFKLRVLRPAGGGQYTGAGTSSPTTATGTATLPIATSLPIQAGDLIGIDYGNGHHLSDTSVTGSAIGEWAPLLANLSTGAPTPYATDKELLFNADVVPEPGISSITPISGSISGGTTVKIAGHDFSGSSVSFGSVPASSFTVDSDNQITAVSPSTSKPGPVDVRVTATGGTSPVVAADKFTYTACVVPQLRKKKLKTDKRILLNAGCKLGKVRGEGRKVTKQGVRAGVVLPPGTRVSVKLG